MLLSWRLSAGYQETVWGGTSVSPLPGHFIWAIVAITSAALAGLPLLKGLATPGHNWETTPLTAMDDVVLQATQPKDSATSLEDSAAIAVVNGRVIRISAWQEAVLIDYVLRGLAGQSPPMLADPSGATAEAYGAFDPNGGTGQMMPAAFVIAPDGHVVWSHVGRDANDRAAVGAILEQAPIAGR